MNVLPISAKTSSPITTMLSTWNFVSSMRFRRPERGLRPRGARVAAPSALDRAWADCCRS